MTWRYDQSPGSDVTLVALYDAVVAAEELDLAEQARLEADWVEIRSLYGFAPVDDDTSDVDEPTEEQAPDDVERPRMSQVVGLIEHLLGGRSIAEG
jgi:hypothetical protein